MSFSRVKPAGWAPNEILTNAQMDALDEDHADAIDGVGAGSYTITAPLEIEGDDITLGAEAGKIVTLGTDGTGAMICKAAAEFQEGLQCTGVATSSFAGDVNFGGNIGLGNAAGDALTINGTSTFNSPATFSAATTLAGAVSLTDPLTISSNGRFLFRAIGAINNAAGSLVVTTTNHYRCPAATLSADRTWTIDDTGAANGDWLLVKNKDVNWTIIVNDPAAANLANLKEGTAVDTAFIMRTGVATWEVIWTSS